MKKILDVLDKIVTQTEDPYVPNENDTNQEQGDRFEKWVCKLLKKELDFHVIDSSKKGMLQTESYKSTKLLTAPLTKYPKLKSLFNKEEWLVIKEQLDDPYRLEYSYDFDIKRNLILFQPRSGKTPDIIVLLGNEIIPIECKTSINGLINLGDGGPKWGHRYVIGNSDTANVATYAGTEINHPINDPKMKELRQRYIIPYLNESRAYIQGKIYSFAGCDTGYNHWARLPFKPTRAVV